MRPRFKWSPSLSICIQDWLQSYQCLNLPASFIIKKNWSRIGLSSLEEQFWDLTKTEGKWRVSPFRERIAAIDRYFNKVKSSQGVSSPVGSVNQNRYLTSEQNYKIWKQGDWLSGDHFLGKGLSNFEERTDFAHKIVLWVKINMLSSFLGFKKAKYEISKGVTGNQLIYPNWYNSRVNSSFKKEEPTSQIFILI